MLGPGQVQVQDAVGVVGFDALGIDGCRQGERLLVLTGLEAVPVNRRSFGNGRFCLPLERNRILLHGDLHCFGIDARHGYLQEKALRRLKQVGGNAATVEGVQRATRRLPSLLVQCCMRGKFNQYNIVWMLQ
jgi:hypothetical protein